MSFCSLLIISTFPSFKKKGATHLASKQKKVKKKRGGRFGGRIEILLWMISVYP